MKVTNYDYNFIIVWNIPGWDAIEIRIIRAKVQSGVWIYKHGRREVVIGEI